MSLYSFEVEIDFGRLGAATFDLWEGGSLIGACTLDANVGPCFLRHADTDYTGYSTNLLGLLKARLEAVGAGDYAVTFNTTTQLITIVATGVASFQLRSLNPLAQKLFGFTGDTGVGTTAVANRAPYRWIKATVPGPTAYRFRQEDNDNMAQDFKSHSGKVTSIAKPGAARKYDGTVSVQPKELTWNYFASATVPYTYEQMILDARSVEYIAINRDDGIDNVYNIVNLRADGCVVDFQPSFPEWEDLWNIQIRAWDQHFVDNNAVVPFVPTDIGSGTLSLWLQPGGLTGGSTPTGWNDSSGNARNFTTAGTAITTATENGVSVLALNTIGGSSASMTCGAALSTIISASAHHTFIVCKPTINFTDATGYLNAILSETSGYWAVGGYYPGSVNRLAHYNWDGNQDVVATNYTADQRVCIETAHRSGNIYLRAHLVGSSSAIASVASGNTTLLTGTLRLGRNYASVYYTGLIAEVVVLNRVLTSQEQSDFRGYLSTQWGVNNPGTDLY